MRRLFRTPGWRLAALTMLVLALYIAATHYLMGGLMANLTWIIVDGVLFLVVFLLAIGFFSQFTLPLRSVEDRLKAFERVLASASGSHGPAIYIENGVVKKRKNEERRSGPGVAILDTASAAMLSKGTAFTRPIGPGVIFTDGNEHLFESLDLYEKQKTLGPSAKDGISPFSARMAEEDITQYEERQRHRNLTSSLTRDGVEVVPNISVSFRLRSVAGNHNTHFGYNPEAVRLAITSEGVRPNSPVDASGRKLAWDEIPVYLAADLWREYLSRFTFEQLFYPFEEDLTTGETKTGLEVIREMVHTHLSQPRYEARDREGCKLAHTEESKEHRLLLDRGIQVTATGIDQLRFNAKVEEKIKDNWEAGWLKNAKKESDLIARRRLWNEIMGKEQALVDFAQAASGVLSLEVPEGPGQHDPVPNADDSLELMLHGTLKLCIRDQDLLKITDKHLPWGDNEVILSQEEENKKDQRKFQRLLKPSERKTTRERLVLLIEWLRRQYDPDS